jgi:hypothetical protein
MLAGAHPPVSVTFDEDGRPRSLARCTSKNGNGGQENKMYLYSSHSLLNHFPKKREAVFQLLTGYKGPCRVGIAN